MSQVLVKIGVWMETGVRLPFLAGTGWEGENNVWRVLNKENSNTSRVEEKQKAFVGCRKNHGNCNLITKVAEQTLRWEFSHWNGIKWITSFTFRFFGEKIY